MQIENINFSETSINQPFFSEFMKSLGNLFCNGSVILRKFKLTKSEYNIIHNFLKKSTIGNLFQINLSLRELFPEMLKDLNDDELGKIEHYSNKDFIEAFRKILNQGSAYKTIDTIPNFNDFFMNSISMLLTSSDCDVKYYFGAWNSWFFNIYWDYTYVVLDNINNTLTFLSITDED